MRRTGSRFEARGVARSSRPTGRLPYILVGREDSGFPTSLRPKFALGSLRVDICAPRVHLVGHVSNVPRHDVPSKDLINGLVVPIGGVRV